MLAAMREGFVSEVLPFATSATRVSEWDRTTSVCLCVVVQEHWASDIHEHPALLDTTQRCSRDKFPISILGLPKGPP